MRFAASIAASRWSSGKSDLIHNVITIHAPGLAWAKIKAMEMCKERYETYQNHDVVVISIDGWLEGQNVDND